MERPMNTAGKDRPILAVIEDHIRNTEKRHTPISHIKLAKDKANNTVNIAVYTSRPEIVRMEAKDIETALNEQSNGKKIVVNVVPEARSVSKYIRMSSRKVRFVIPAIKGKRVSEALDILRFIPNHASEPISKAIRSAAANALDSWGAGPEELKVHNVIADGGPILKRIRARAQGRAYRILKRTTHLTVVLLEAPKPVAKRKPVAKVKKPVAVAPVKTPSAKPVVETPVEETNAALLTQETAPEITTAPVAAESTAPEVMAEHETTEAVEAPAAEEQA